MAVDRNVEKWKCDFHLISIKNGLFMRGIGISVEDFFPDIQLFLSVFYFINIVPQFSEIQLTHTTNSSLFSQSNSYYFYI